MKLEIIMLSEISQAQKDKYHIFIHTESEIIIIMILDCKKGTVCGGHQWKE
jgi:hypothetical protein